MRSLYKSKKVRGLFALNTGFRISNDDSVHIAAFLVSILIKFNIFISLNNNTSGIGLAGAMFVAGSEHSDSGDSGQS